MTTETNETNFSSIETDAGVLNNEPNNLEFSLNEYTPQIIESCDDFSTEEQYPGEGGLIYIFNHYEFKDELKLKQRKGTEHDVIALNKCFKDTFGFECITHNDKSKQEIFEIIKDANPDKEIQFFGVVILSHGKMNEIAANNAWYRETEFLDALNKNEALKDKLKIIICQLCRDSIESEINQLIQLHDDNLFIHSSYPEKVAHRDTKNGTFLIQILCKRLNIMRAENDILDELIFIQSDIGTVTKGVQMPVVSYNMRKIFTLKPKKHGIVTDE